MPMALMLAELAQIGPNADTRSPFWDACRAPRAAPAALRRLRPLPPAAAAGLPALRLDRAASGRSSPAAARLQLHDRAPPGGAGAGGDVPYNVVVVELDDAPGRAADQQPARRAARRIRIGMRGRARVGRGPTPISCCRASGAPVSARDGARPHARSAASASLDLSWGYAGALVDADPRRLRRRGDPRRAAGRRRAARAARVPALAARQEERRARPARRRRTRRRVRLRASAPTSSLETFRPGVAERLGLGRTRDLASGNPGLVHTSITGFGRARPVRRTSRATRASCWRSSAAWDTSPAWRRVRARRFPSVPLCELQRRADGAARHARRALRARAHRPRPARRGDARAGAWPRTIRGNGSCASLCERYPEAYTPAPPYSDARRAEPAASPSASSYA